MLSGLGVVRKWGTKIIGINGGVILPTEPMLCQNNGAMVGVFFNAGFCGHLLFLSGLGGGVPIAHRRALLRVVV